MWFAFTELLYKYTCEKYHVVRDIDRLVTENPIFGQKRSIKSSILMQI